MLIRMFGSDIHPRPCEFVAEFVNLNDIYLKIRNKMQL